jgi:hypothetical protein
MASPVSPLSWSVTLSLSKGDYMYFATDGVNSG